MKHCLLFVTLIFLATSLKALTVTAFKGIYHDGQVFFTWNLDAGTGSVYKLYRSNTQITSGTQLASCEYLGLTHRNSATNNNLTNHDNITRYWIVQNGGIPLTSSQGLFVTTSVANGSYYYALTVTLTTEDQTIIAGSNSLTVPVAETVTTPLPVFQETRTINGFPVDIYGDFFSSRNTLDGPLEMYAGWLGYDFAVFRNTGVPLPHPLHIRFHAGGTDFLNKITNAPNDEVNLGLEDYFPDVDNSAWLGSNPGFDPYNMSNNSPPLSGYNYFYTHERLIREIKWVETNCDIDTNRIYAEGNSFGCNGAFLLLLLHPDLFAAVDLTGGLFNFGFTTDHNPDVTMNTGQKNRIAGDKLLGTVTLNLPVGTYTYHTYDLLNADFMIHQYNEENYPVIYSINGRQDEAMGWTEKPIWYDSVENNHLGGYYFFDNRDHAGINRYWSSTNYDMFRYFRNVSYPAFSGCNLNANPGNGYSTNGDSVGTINGFLDWKTTAADITDISKKWAVSIYMKDLAQQFGGVTVAPDSCFANISLRRIQKFHPASGSQLSWTVVHHNHQVQSGSFLYSGGLITIPGVRIFKDTMKFTISSPALNTYYADADHDGFGNINVTITAASPPPGYVASSTDCNDGNSAIHPGANELCNNIDDDCDGAIDDSTFTANISPSGAVSACNSDHVKFIADNGTGLSYQWYLNNAVIPGETSRNYKSNGSESGIYQVKETNSTGCIAWSSTASLTRIDNPTAVIKVTGNLNICTTGSVDLKAKAGTGISWQWKKNGSVISGATKQKYTATAIGDYTVTVVNATGCSKESPKTTVYLSCRQAANSDSEIFTIVINPNPASDYVTFNVVGESVGNFDIQFMNLLGQVIFSKIMMVTDQDRSAEISLKQIPDGMYLVKISSNSRSFLTSLVIRNQ